MTAPLPSQMKSSVTVSRNILFAELVVKERIELVVTPRAHVRSGVKQWVLSVSVCVSQSVSQSVSVSSKFWADHDNEGSKRF